MTTPTSHGATEPHPVSEGLTDALGGGGRARGWATASQKVSFGFILPSGYNPPFSSALPKVRTLGTSGSNLPSQHTYYFGRSEGT